MSISGIIQRVLNRIVKRSYWYNHIEFAECAKFWNHRTFDMDVVNLGSSSALAAFNYSEYPQLKAANWAMAPQSLVADYEILKNYSCYLHEGAFVIIPICPFSCLGGSNDELPDKYYTILNISSIPHASYRRKQVKIQVKDDPWLYYPMSQLFSKNTQSAGIDKRKFEDDAIKRMENWRKEFSIIRFSDSLSLVNKDAYMDGVDVLSRIVNYCLEKMLVPIVVMPPVSKAMQKQFNPEIKKKFIDDFVEQSIGERVMYFDHFDDERFTLEYFKNSFIMNETGAKQFTDIILKEIGIIK